MAQQLPRCMQQASWMRVWSKVGGGQGGMGGMGGGVGMSMRGISSFTVRAEVAMSIRGFVSQSRSQSLLILCRPSSSSLSSHRVSRSVGSSVDRSSIASPGIGRNFADGLAVSGGYLRANRLPLLSLFPTRGLSSAEASALTDGFLKESLVKDGEEKLGTPLAGAAETEVVAEEVGAPSDVLSALETDEARERDILVAEIHSKELELAELRSALRLIEVKQGVEVNGSDSASRVATGFPEVDDSVEQANSSQLSAALQDSVNDSVEQATASQVSAALQDSVNDYVSARNGTSALPEDLPSGSLTSIETEDLQDSGISVAVSEVGGEDEAGSKSIPHPWPEWMEFLKQLDKGGHFVNEDQTVVDMNGSTNDDIGLIKRACLNFARERDDIFLHYSRKNLEAIARFGCPSTDRKVVNAGKRLRDFLAIDEISVCKPCSLRSSCERRDFKASANHVSGTPEVIRLLCQYALEVSPYAKEGLQIPGSVQTACTNLLKETIALGTVPRDPSIPKIERPKAEVAVKSDRREREGKRKIRDSDVEMKPGDWKCEECQYVNFARNRTCRECDAFRPVPEMRPGDWRCAECNFVNFSRNDECHDCKADRPAGSGYKSSYDSGSRYDRGAPQSRGESRFDRGERRSEVRSYNRGSERGPRDYDRGTDRFDSRGRGDRESQGRSWERGSVERRAGTDDTRGGRRSNFEEWKPDLKTRGDFDEDEHKGRRSALDNLDDDEDDDDIDDFEFDSDNEELSDVEPFEDEEFEDMKPRAAATRGRGDTGSDREVARSRSGGRNDDKDPWWEDDRTFRSDRSDSDRSDRGSRAGGVSGRGGRGGGRGGRGDFGSRDRRSSRDSRPSSYERSGRDSGRSYERSERDSTRPSRGRGGGRGGGRGRGRR